MKSTEPANRHKAAIQVQQQHYSGPLPKPEDLAKYNQVVPGAAERIIAMAEKEMDFRHKSENKLQGHAVRIATVSIVFAFVSVLILSGLVWFALYKGFDTVAASIAVGSIAAVAGVFMFFKTKKNG